MTDIITNFRHGVMDEPKENWTVEEVFQWTLLRSLLAIDERTEELAQELRQQVEDGLEEIERFSTGKQPQHEENQDPNAMITEDAGAIAHTSDTKKPENSFVRASSYTMLIDTLQGEHEGKQFQISITESQPAWLGRSRGKKFAKGKGISLPKDFEVSTSHGKFALIDGRPYFVDTGSTNGSLLVLSMDAIPGIQNVVPLKPDDPSLISLEPDGTLFRFGQSLLRVVVVEYS